MLERRGLRAPCPSRALHVPANALPVRELASEYIDNEKRHVSAGLLERFVEFLEPTVDIESILIDVVACRFL